MIENMLFRKRQNQFQINIKKFLSLKLDKIDFLVYKKISFYQFQIKIHTKIKIHEWFEKKRQIKMKIYIDTLGLKFDQY